MGYPFGARDHSTLKLVSELNTTLLFNYGHAGPHFVRWLLQQRDHWPSFERRYVELKQWFVGRVCDDAALRLSDYAAVIAIAAELAHEALDLPWSATQAIPDTLWQAIVEEASALQAICERCVRSCHGPMRIRNHFMAERFLRRMAALDLL